MSETNFQSVDPHPTRRSTSAAQYGKSLGKCGRSTSAAHVRPNQWTSSQVDHLEQNRDRIRKSFNSPMEAEWACCSSRHKFAPSNQPCLFARTMRVQIVLGARLHPAQLASGRWPVPFRDAGLRGRRNRRWSGTVARSDISAIHVVIAKALGFAGCS